MKIVIQLDYREKAFIKIITALKKQYRYDHIEMTIENLDLGDIIFCRKNNDDTLEELCIFERKSLNDLVSSIKDGRYSEQSYRLTNYKVHNHNIIYLLEGNMAEWDNKYTKMEKKTLYTTMFSLNYFKGFSVIKINDILETCDYILRSADKLSREKKKKGYFEDDEPKKVESYCHVVSKVKKKNITFENIDEIILSQIPGISAKMSVVIMNHFDSLYDLLSKLKEDPMCLNGITYMGKDGKTKKLPKTTINNIVQYLLYKKSNTIKVQTE